MSWPSHFPTSGAPLRQRVLIDSQAFAQMTKAFVVSACGTVDDNAIERLQVTTDQEVLLRSADFCGGSTIVAPDSSVVAGPLGPEEDILYADLDLEIGVRMKLRHDFAGHYNRPDVFQLRVHVAPANLFDMSPSTVLPAADGDAAPSLENQKLPPSLPAAGPAAVGQERPAGPAHPEHTGKPASPEHLARTERAPAGEPGRAGAPCERFR